MPLVQSMQLFRCGRGTELSRRGSPHGEGDIPLDHFAQTPPVILILHLFQIRRFLTPKPWLQVLAITSVSPAILSATGWTLINITSAGIDTDSCGDNAVSVGGFACGVVACGTGFVTALYPGSSGAPDAAASVTVSLYDPADTSLVVDTATWSGSIEISDSGGAAPSVGTLLASPSNGAGGPVSAVIVGSGTDPAYVTSMSLMPVPSAFTYAALLSSLSAR